MKMTVLDILIADAVIHGDVASMRPAKLERLKRLAGEIIMLFAYKKERIENNERLGTQLYHGGGRYRLPVSLSPLASEVP